jgi:Holliday junction resolvase RusA-like endonuclease
MRELSFTVPGRCVPCPRVRVKRGARAYYPRRYTDWLASAKVEAYKACGRPLLEGAVGVNVTFYGARPNADIDNLLKSVMDAIQGVIIVDDKQVQVVVARKEPADGEPETHIQVSPYRDGGE